MSIFISIRPQKLSKRSLDNAIFVSDCFWSVWLPCCDNSRKRVSNANKKTKIQLEMFGSAPYISTERPQCSCYGPPNRQWKDSISISINYESECAIIAALAVALFVCLGNSVKVRAVELASSPAISHHSEAVPKRDSPIARLYGEPPLARRVIVVSDLQLQNAMNSQLRGFCC